MILLDTNVVSEVMKPQPNPAVRAWLNEQAAETLFLSSLTLAELWFGIGALPAGKRRNMLAETPDGYIAAIAASRGFIVASRDTAPYLAAKITVINPWET